MFTPSFPRKRFILQILQEVIYGNIGGYTATVGVENYYLPYDVKVQAFNDLGDGPNTTVEVVYSAMGSKFLGEHYVSLFYWHMKASFNLSLYKLYKSIGWIWFIIQH